jgi:hypothetical protein
MDLVLDALKSSLGYSGGIVLTNTTPVIVN